MSWLRSITGGTLGGRQVAPLGDDNAWDPEAAQPAHETTPPELTTGAHKLLGTGAERSFVRATFERTAALAAPTALIAGISAAAQTGNYTTITGLAPAAARALSLTPPPTP